MDAVADLELDDAVSTQATNWSFVGEPTAPAWENTSTGHQLLIRESNTDEYDYAVELNHETQLRPFWTITEEDFAAELIPIVEWVLSVPEDDLFNREAMAYALKPFWDEQRPSAELQKKQHE